MQGKGTPPTSKKIQVSPKYPAPNTHSPSKRMLPKSTPPQLIIALARHSLKLLKPTIQRPC